MGFRGEQALTADRLKTGETDYGYNTRLYRIRLRQDKRRGSVKK